MRLVGYAVAVLAAAALTLACTIALVQGAILAISVESFAPRTLAMTAVLLFGTVLLLGCIYLATHLAVLLLGVGNAEFPALPVDEYSSEVRSGDSAKI